jgi:hypothetical protein
MQHVLTGLGTDGRSTVLDRRDLSSPPGDEVVVERVWGTDALPPRVSQSLESQGEPADIGVPQVGSKLADREVAARSRSAHVSQRHTRL